MEVKISWVNDKLIWIVSSWLIDMKRLKKTDKW